MLERVRSGNTYYWKIDKDADKILKLANYRKIKVDLLEVIP